MGSHAQTCIMIYVIACFFQTRNFLCLSMQNARVETSCISKCIRLSIQESIKTMLPRNPRCQFSSSIRLTKRMKRPLRQRIVWIINGQLTNPTTPILRKSKKYDITRSGNYKKAHGQRLDTEEVDKFSRYLAVAEEHE